MARGCASTTCERGRCRGGVPIVLGVYVYGGF